MTILKRKHIRRPVIYPGQIDLGDGSPPRECKLLDASAEGALIGIEAPEKLPDAFTLVLGYDGTARRRCRVVWRSEDQIGVEFLKEPKVDDAPMAAAPAAKPPAAKPPAAIPPAESPADKP